MIKNPIEVSVLIVGGGLVGGVVAAFLKQSNIPFILIDPQDPKTMLDAVSDGRTTAISLGSKKILYQAGLWTNLLDQMACPIEHIRVYEENSISVLDFDAQDLSHEPMGYIVENMYIRESILSNLKDYRGVYYETSLVDIKKESSGVFATLSNGVQVKSQLLISAEGRGSVTRNLIAPKIKSRDYAQTALVVHLEHEKPHKNRAWEVFTQDGPFAILPLRHSEGKKSGIVYAKSKNFDWNTQTDLMIEEEIQRFFPFYGAFKIKSPRWTFPLTVFEASAIVGHRQALVGDAAHGMHPLAGQGVNLGWRDAEVICDLIIQNHLVGIDVGNQNLLNQYERKRKKDIKTLLKSTDFINEIFQHPSKTMYYARNAGLSIVNQLPKLKQFFMKKAMGI